ncbi:MAG: hypothetical protein ABSF46_12130 [Terriglobia bacterium]
MSRSGDIDGYVRLARELSGGDVNIRGVNFPHNMEDRKGPRIVIHWKW